MTLQELYNLIIIRSGEFIIGEVDVELDIDKFKVLVSNCLKIYSKYKPKRELLSVYLSNFKYTFTDNVPEFISDVIPVYSSMLNPLFVGFNIQGLDIPPFVEWEYRKPTLYTNFNGRAEVTAWYNWELAVDDSGTVIVPLEDELFLDLVLGEFLIALGRERRAFRLTEIPIEIDADRLVDEGQKICENVIESLRNTSILL